ncbi:TetR/AcrR family transcriptional regulator [Streptosporangium sp. NPDC051022]|uniref:TetR/AcrR family transcriptional regulator n=1 Tax=Streptosporangium sp. NPDC051022 TaxID=3155752 RepID=UPI00344041CF
MAETLSKAESFLADDRDPPSKRRILVEALRLFVEQGVDGTTVRDISRASGYSNPALFKFFASKEELALHLFGRCYTHLGERASLACAPGRPFGERLGSLMRTFGQILEEQPQVLLYVQDNLRVYWPRLTEAERGTALIEVLRGLLRDGVASGEVTTTISIDLLVAALSGTVAQYARMRQFGELPPGTASSVLEPLFIRMISP